MKTRCSSTTSLEYGWRQKEFSSETRRTTMASSSKGVREKNDRRVLAKNRERTNNTEVDRSKQGRQRTSQLSIEDSCPWSKETTWSIAWTHVVQQHASLGSCQDLMFRTGNWEKKQERKRCEVGFVWHLKRAFLRRGPKRDLRYIATWRWTRRILCNTQDASHVWQEDYSNHLKRKHFHQGQAWTSVFRHDELDIKLLVHGDDFMVLADQEGQEYMHQVLKEKYEYKRDGEIGKGSRKHLTILNRIVTYEQNTGRATYEANPRHAEMIIRQLNLQNAKSVTTPAEKKKSSEVLASVGLPPVTAEQTTLYRSLAMRAQFLAQDRADLSEAVKSLTRKMKAPNESDMKDLKRLGRYLVGRVVNVYHPQRPTNVIKVHADSDHAGCVLTRRSTTGYTISIGTHCVKHGSNLQSTIALSSGEREFYALTRGAALGLNLKSLMADWGQKYDLIVLSDSSAARGTAARRGLGKLRHVQTRYLWVQERVTNNDLTVKCVNTKQNLADLCAKPVRRETCEKDMRTLCQEFRDGKASGAKALQSTKVCWRRGVEISPPVYVLAEGSIKAKWPKTVSMWKTSVLGVC